MIWRNPGVPQLGTHTKHTDIDMHKAEKSHKCIQSKERKRGKERGKMGREEKMGSTKVRHEKNQGPHL